MFTHPDTNSIESLRYRADRLVKDGVSEDNPMVTLLRKIANLKEKGELPKDAGI